MFPALRSRNYRRFVGAQGISLIGSWTETVAQGILILSLTHSPVALGAAVALRYLPVLVLGPLAGVFVDRHDRRKTLLLTQTTLGATSGIFGIVAILGWVQPWQIFVVAILFGLVTAVDNPARMALIPELVDKDSLRNAVTLNSILANVGRGVGPVVAASLIGTIGVGWCFVVNAATFGVVIVVLASLRTAEIHSEGRIPRTRGQLAQTLRVVRADPQLLAPLVMMAVVGTLTYEFEVTLPVFAERTLDAGAAEYAWLTAGFGLGAVLAGIALVLRPQRTAGRMAAISAFYGIALAATAFAPASSLANTLIVVVGACSIGFLVTGNSTIQLAAPVGMRGRVTALWTAAFQGSTPIGGLLMGGAAGLWGGRVALLIGAAACLLAACLGAAILRAGARQMRSA